MLIRIFISCICVALLNQKCFSSSDEVISDLDFLQKIVEYDHDGLPTWSKSKWQVIGCNEPSEQLLTAVVRRGWSIEGYWLSLEVLNGHNIISSNGHEGTFEKELINIYLDVREANARMDVYEKGVAHFRIDRSNPQHVLELDSKLRLIPNVRLGSAKVSYQLTSTGWKMDVFIPWDAVAPNYAPTVGAPIATALQIIHEEPLLGKRLSIGDQSVDVHNKLEDTPGAFTPSIFGEGVSEDQTVSIRTVETVVGDQPTLQLSACLRTPQPSVKDSFTALTDLGVSTAELHSSYSGAFLVSKLLLPISQAARKIGVTKISVAVPNMHWQRTIQVRIPLAKAFAEIDDLIPDDSIDKLEDNDQSIVHLLKECARETAALYSTEPDGRRPAQKRFRAITKSGIYDAKIHLFTDFAFKLMTGKINGRLFPYQAWQSQIDKSWQPLKIIYPLNYDPSHLYPVRIIVYGLNRNRTRAQFLENDLLAIHEGLFYPNLGDCFTIVTYGRGNSHEDFGEEELQYIKSDIIKKLPVDVSRVSIYGGSAGALSALEIGMRHPDWFSWIELRGGYFEPLWDSKSNRRLLSLKNLKSSKVYILAGEFDKVAISSAQKLNDALTAAGVESELKVMPTAFHSFSPDEPPVGFSDYQIPAKPATIEFDSPSLEYATLNWLRIDSVITWGENIHVKATAREQEISVEFNNVGSFSLRLDAMPDKFLGKKLVVNGQVVRDFTIKIVDGWVSFSYSRNNWQIRDSERGLENVEFEKKRRGHSGPAKQIECRKMLIAYGTQNSETALYLRERAYQIARVRAGPDRFQWSGRTITVKADEDVTENDIAENNIWLIGGSEDNKLVSKWRGSLPLDRAASIERSSVTHLKTEAKLISFIYPSPDKHGLVFVEAGNQPLSYACPIMANPEADITIQRVTGYGSQVTGSGNFTNDWKDIVPSNE